MREVRSSGVRYRSALFRIVWCGLAFCLAAQFTAMLILFGGAAPAVCQPVSSSAAHTLSVEQAVSLAQEHNLRVKNAELELGRSGDRLAAERTRLLPTFRVTALGAQLLTPLDFKFSRANVGGTTNSPGPFVVFDQTIHNGLVPALFLNARFSQPISELPRTKLKIQQFLISQAIAREKLRQQRQELVNEVKSAYFVALEKESALVVAQKTLFLYREIDRVTQDHLAQRMLLPGDSLAVKKRLAAAEYELLCLRDSVTTQKERLNQLLGRRIDTEFALVPVPPARPVELDLRTARARALSARAEVRLIQNERRHVEFERRITKQKFLPDLSLNLNYLSVFGLQLLPKNVMSVGLLLSWEPWDMGRKLRELSEQTKELKQSENALQELENQIAVDVGASFRRLQQSRRQLEVTSLGQAEAQEQLRVLMDRYKVQSALLKDVLQSETALAQANHEHQQSLLSFWTAKADFEKITGED